MHAKKFTRGESVHLLGHIKREHLYYTNENIDLSKSHLNVIYQNRTVDSVLNGVHIHGKNGKSADKINYTVSIAVHYPHKCPISEKEFFGYMNYILSTKFGKNNVVCSVVHYDEKRSHMHFVFCPIVEDRKHRRKLCCKEVVNREMLQTLHEDIEKELFDLCGKTVSLRNDEETRGIPHVDDIEVYKKLKDLENKYNDLYLRFQKNMQVIQEQENYIHDLKTQLFKCIDLLNEAEKKDIKLLGFSPISNELDDLYKKVDEIEMG